MYYSLWKVRFIFVGFKKKKEDLNFLERLSKKYSNIKFHKNLVSGSPVIP